MREQLAAAARDARRAGVRESPVLRRVQDLRGSLPPSGRHPLRSARRPRSASLSAKSISTTPARPGVTPKKLVSGRRRPMMLPSGMPTKPKSSTRRPAIRLAAIRGFVTAVKSLQMTRLHRLRAFVKLLHSNGHYECRNSRSSGHNHRDGVGSHRCGDRRWALRITTASAKPHHEC